MVSDADYDYVYHVIFEYDDVDAVVADFVRFVGLLIVVGFAVAVVVLRL